MSLDTCAAKKPALLSEGLYENAFTFVEIMVALAIVSISLLALIRLHLVSIRLVEASKINTRAVLLAQEKIAEILAVGFPNEGASSGTIEDNALRLHWQANVTPLQLSQLKQASVTGLRKVSVDVSWEHTRGYKHIQLSTCVANREIQ
jgi:prepilin-type N-terminal cleavage/methylation domain-containing protein